MPPAHPTIDLREDVQAVWADVLGTAAIGPADEFFALGGNSLKATMVMSRLRDQTGVEIPLRLMYATPTLDAFAAAVGDLVGTTPSREQPAIEAIDRSGPIAVSAPQERMWLLHQMQPTGTAYNLERALRLTGVLRVDALQTAFEELFARHESLRTGFIPDADAPFQRIEPTCVVEIPLVDLGPLARDERLPAVVQAMQRVVGTPFDLANPPLVRIRLFRLADDDHVLFVVMHHSVSDDWAFGVLMRELAELYNSQVAGEASRPLPRLQRQHADFAAWHRQWLESEALDDQLDYWRVQLAGLAPADLPSDHVRSAGRTSNGAAIIVPFTDEISRQTEDLARRHQASQFMVLLACYQLLLHRYTGAEDISVGAPIANRNWLESEQLISTFVNTLVLRTDLAGDPTFEELLLRVRAVALDAFEHQDVPFDRVVTELRPPRDASRTPFFQAFFNVGNTPVRPPRLTGLTVEPMTFDTQSAQFDVSLSIDPVWSKTMVLDYTTDIFDGDRMRRMMDHYITLLGAALAAPHRRISELEMLTPVESAALDATEHAADVDYDRTALVHDLVSARARQQADAVAVSHAGRSLTYGELDARANQLAHHLIDVGITPGQLVGIHLARAPEMVIALLATLKAGAAYLPMDPGFPIDRLEFMVADSRTTVVITTADLLPSVTDGPTYVCLERDAAAISSRPTTDPGVGVASDSLAYVIYTSGSTGRPKGVQLEHRNVVNFLCSMTSEPGLDSSDVLLAVTTLSFDISVLEIFLPLVNGAHLVLVDRETTLDPAALVAAMEHHRPTIMQATPTTWRMVVDAGWRGAPALRVLCGGEPLPAELAAALVTRCGALWNMYGPTETTVWSALKRIAPDFARVSIGTAIANTSLHVVDAYGHRLPVGIQGELLIGGEGVARGYLDRPELTAERFIPHPTDPVARVYRTGDMAQRLPNGDIDLLGRMDGQVKIRGHRIELGEIETMLAGHPDVTQAVVSTHQYAPSDTRIVAYYTHRGTTEAAQLRAYLQAVLPNYMVPSAFVPLGSFPLTPNKKVDRRALPPPLVAADHDVSRPPRPGIETDLAAIWRDVLGIADIDPDDDFFDLGGHSLLAVRVFARIQELTGRTYPLTSLFKAPTVAALAELLEADGWRTEWTSLTAVQPSGDRPPYFVVSPFLITALSFATLARELGPDQPLYVFQPQGMDSDAPAHPSVEQMAAHYINEMKQVQGRGPYRLGGHCAGNWVAFEMAYQLQRAGDEVATLVLVDSEPPGIVPPRRNVVVHLAQRATHYARDRRLRESLAWKISVLRERLKAWHAHHADGARVAAVRSTHADAHRRYQGRTVTGDATLIRSEESTILRDKDWHLRWAEVITGALRVEIVPGTHAGLLQPGNVDVLASIVTDALGGRMGDVAEATHRLPAPTT